MLAAAALILPYRVRIPHFLPLLLAISTAVHLVAVFVFHTPVSSDFKTMYEAAQQVANGDFSFQNTDYFFRWAYQTGFVLWEAVILKLTGSMTAIKIVNALLLSGINGMIYILARRFTSERAAQSAALLYLVTAFPTLMCCVLTNQQSSAFFLVLALCILTGGGTRAFSLLRAGLAGVCLAVGNILRPEAIVILAGLYGTLVFVVVMRRSIRRSWPMIRGVLLATVVYFACTGAASAAVTVSGVNQYGLTNNWPAWKFIVGFNQETYGWYSADDMETFGASHQIDTTEEDLAAAEETESQVIHDRVFTSPAKLFALFARKAYSLWMAQGLGFPLGYLNTEKITSLGFVAKNVYQYFIWLDRTVFVCALLLCLLGAAALLRRKPQEQTFSAVLAPMTTMAFFCVFLLIEVQPRYAFLPQIFLYVTAAAGIAAVHRRLRGAEQLAAAKKELHGEEPEHIGQISGKESPYEG